MSFDFIAFMENTFIRISIIYMIYPFLPPQSNQANNDTKCHDKRFSKIEQNLKHYRDGWERTTFSIISLLLILMLLLLLFIFSS